MSTSYKLKSSARRAAKTQYGEDWEKTHSVDLGDDGQYTISEKGQALQAFLADHEADLKGKKAKAIEIKAAHKIETAIPYPIEGGIKAFIDEIDGEKDASTSNEAEKVKEMGLVEEAPGVFTNSDADKAADVALVNVDPLKPRVSTTEKPVKKVWAIADEMNADAKAAGKPAPTRSEVQAECVKRGIAYGTARTQYQAWFKCINDSKSAPIAKINADGSISFPGK